MNLQEDVLPMLIAARRRRQSPAARWRSRAPRTRARRPRRRPADHAQLRRVILRSAMSFPSGNIGTLVVAAASTTAPASAAASPSRDRRQAPSPRRSSTSPVKAASPTRSRFPARRPRSRAPPPTTMTRRHVHEQHRAGTAGALSLCARRGRARSPSLSAARCTSASNQAAGQLHRHVQRDRCLQLIDCSTRKRHRQSRCRFSFAAHARSPGRQPSCYIAADVHPRTGARSSRQAGERDRRRASSRSAALPPRRRPSAPSTDLSFGSFIAGSGGTITVTFPRERARTAAGVFLDRPGRGRRGGAVQRQRHRRTRRYSITLPANNTVILSDGKSHTMTVEFVRQQPRGDGYALGRRQARRSASARPWSSAATSRRAPTPAPSPSPSTTETGRRTTDLPLEAVVHARSALLLARGAPRRRGAARRRACGARRPDALSDAHRLREEPARGAGRAYQPGTHARDLPDQHRQPAHERDRRDHALPTAPSRASSSPTPMLRFRRAR